MGVRASTARRQGRGTGGTNAYHGRIIGGTAHVGSYWNDLWLCSHFHDNRDNDSNTVASARTCAEFVLSQWVQVAPSGQADDVRAITRWLNKNAPVSGLFLLSEASSEQIDWLARRADYIREGKASNVGNRRSYPEGWVKIAGERYRGKLWEKETKDGHLIRRLFVAGPFGSNDFIEGYIDLDTRTVHVPSQHQGAFILMGWQEAAQQLETGIPSWAPKTRSARESLGGDLQRGRVSDIKVPSVYRVRINRDGGTRTYDVVDVQGEEVDVLESGLSRVQAYKRVSELNERATS